MWYVGDRKEGYRRARDGDDLSDEGFMTSSRFPFARIFGTAFLVLSAILTLSLRVYQWVMIHRIRGDYASSHMHTHAHAHTCTHMCMHTQSHAHYAIIQ